MYTYAQILNGKVHWIMQDEMGLEELYVKKYCKNDVTFVDISLLGTKPEAGWSYDGTVFSAPDSE